MTFKKRAALGAALIGLLLTVFVFGIVWAVLYWGGMLPLQTYIINLYTVNIFPNAEYQFMVAMGVFWGFIVTLAVLINLWQQSTRRDDGTV